MNGDITARRDAASMMMSMSHLMDAAAVHAQQQQQQSTSATATTNMHGEINTHHNHTNRGPHKKRTASNASLDDPSRTKGKATSASSASGSSNSNTSTSNGPLTEEEKKAERRAANRRSAFQSRQRRKILIEDLQRTVAALSKDNNDIRKNNDDLRSQLEAALLENRQLRQITSSLSAQAHAQQAQVAAQQVQHQQQSAPVSQQQATGSPAISAQQAPPTVPAISQPQPPTVAIASSAPSPFVSPSLTSSTAALTNFLTNFSSQAAGAAPSSDQQQHIFNAKIALLAAQSRVSELEHHQAAQAQAVANAAVAQQQQHQAQLQAQAQAAASAALGLAHVQASTPGNAALSDAQHLARLQELLARGINNASAATAAPVATTVAPPVATAASNASANSISAAGVDLSHLRSLLEAQQQQQHQGVGAVQAPGPISAAPESPARPTAQEPVVTKSEPDLKTTGGASSASSETLANVGSSTTKSLAPQSSSSTVPAVTTTSSTPAVHPATLSTAASQDAPGIQLLIESLRAGQNGTSNSGSAPPLDEAVRNYIKQQQMVQQQAQQTSNATIKAESS